MGLFSRKDNKQSKAELSSFLNDDDGLGAPASSGPSHYEAALSYLVGLSDKDYQTVCKVAQIYRKANDDAGKALGKPVQATAFIEPPLSEDQRDDLAIQEILDEADDDKEAAFLQTEPKKIQVKDK